MSDLLTWRWGDPIAPLAAIVERGGVLAIPTESSYALAVDPRNPRGVAAVYRIKAREAGKPLPVVVAGVDQLAGLGIDPELPLLRPILGMLALAWPGPLTAVLPLTHPLPAAAGEPSLAVRVPGHARLRTLLSELGLGLTATSANPSGGAPAIVPEAAASLLAGEDGALIDDGVLAGGLPSTLVRWTPAGFAVLRAGSYPEPRLAALLAESRAVARTMRSTEARPAPGEAKNSTLPRVVGTYVDREARSGSPVPRKTEDRP